MKLITIPKGPLKLITIHGGVLSNNIANGVRNPCIQVYSCHKQTSAHQVEIHGPSKILYPERYRHPTGARVWIETDAEVDLIIEE